MPSLTRDNPNTDKRMCSFTLSLALFVGVQEKSGRLLYGKCPNSGNCASSLGFLISALADLNRNPGRATYYLYKIKIIA